MTDGNVAIAIAGARFPKGVTVSTLGGGFGWITIKVSTLKSLPISVLRRGASETLTQPELREIFLPAQQFMPEQKFHCSLSKSYGTKE